MAAIIAGLLLIGPIPFLPAAVREQLSALPIFIAGLVVFGAGCALSFIPLPAEMLSVGQWLRPNGKGDASHAAAALVSACFSAGAFIAPLMSSSITQTQR